ncbi:MAG: 5-(carboxyamino)imidazole ribonucleotide mutase [Candidatus Andersenbacteria bacterium]
MNEILLICGSPSDLPIMKASKMHEVFEACGLDVKPNVFSAHRNPEELRTFLSSLGTWPLAAICVAGMTNALAGVVVGFYKGIVPVIGVALSSPPLDGMDALLSCTRMPPGRPVLCSGIDKPGLYNAAIAACAIVGQSTRLHNLASYLERSNKKPQTNVDWATIDAK